MIKNVSIIGGSGFIGTRLCGLLSNRSDLTFSILDITKSEKYPEHWKYLDIRDIDSVRDCLTSTDIVINLAAEHRDDVSPKSKYYETNVTGQKQLCAVMAEQEISTLIFTSSVAIYGFVTQDTSENGNINPFHEYGDSKYKAEQESQHWFEDGKQLSVIRPTVVFGEGNRGNVYNLLKQIASGKFLMIGDGTNKKSMAYVENIAAFIEHLIDHGAGHQVFNYSDKPDFNMNDLVDTVNNSLKKKTVKLHIPYFFGLSIGYFFDFLAFITNKKLPISSLRIKKFCSPTQFKTNTDYAGFCAPCSLEEGLTATVKHEFKR